MTNILLILYPIQLFENKYINKILTWPINLNNNLHILLVEHPYFFTKYKYNKNKLILHRASMRNYYDLLDKNNYDCEYIQFNQMDKIELFIKTKLINQIRFFNPIEKELLDDINTNHMYINIEKLIFPTPYFLNSSKINQNNLILEELENKIRHDLFYKSQRIKYNIMVTKSDNKYIPDGSKWSFDSENRKKFEKTQHEPELLSFDSKLRKKYLKEAREYIGKYFSNNYGTIETNSNFIYPINRTESIQWLKHFIKYKLDNFGKYQDALSSKIKFGYHSLLSPLMNIGLITPFDIIENVKDFNTNISSKEGFIRQIIGWREYCYFTYDLFKEYLETHTLYSNKNIHKYSIPKYIWESNTQIPPIDNILINLSSNGYSHHIERLMGIGNFLILIGIKPIEIFKWFQTMYIDAYDVFMVPNIYGMLSYGKLTELSHMMTRPYFSSSNYLIKMSDYKSNSCVKINNNIYKWDEIIDSLYWNHVNNYSNEFKKIYATASAVSKFNNFDSDKKKRLLELANIYIQWIHQD